MYKIVQHYRWLKPDGVTPMFAPSIVKTFSSYWKAWLYKSFRYGFAEPAWQSSFRWEIVPEADLTINEVRTSVHAGGDPKLAHKVRASVLSSWLDYSDCAKCEERQ